MIHYSSFLFGLFNGLIALFKAFIKGSVIGLKVTKAITGKAARLIVEMAVNDPTAPARRQEAARAALA
jgi:predicted lipid-binding transport protein (Tim44 family)